VKQNKSPFKCRHFEPTIILLCVRWYCRYQLSYRDLTQRSRSFHTAERTTEGIEPAHMMRKGRVKRLAGRAAVVHAKRVACLFGVAA